MGTQCKSATLPDAVSPFLTDQQCHWTAKLLGFADVREDRVGEDKSEDLPSASSNMCLRDYGHSNNRKHEEFYNYKKRRLEGCILFGQDYERNSKSVRKCKPAY